MAEIKISALPSASSLAGTEMIPLVQGGTTKEALLSLIETKIMTTADALMDAKIAAIPASPGSDSIYTASGDVFDTGVATTRTFNFNTDPNSTYNPFTKVMKMQFNQTVDILGVTSPNPGSISFVGTSFTAGEVASGNISTNKINFSTVNTSGRQRIFEVNLNDARLFSTGPLGDTTFKVNNDGAFITDTRSSQNGIMYSGDYSTEIITKDRSIPDVGAVKKLRQQANTWTTGTRPAVPDPGTFGLNTTIPQFEGYDGTAWVALS